jgi:hypothetical protein
MIVTFWLDGEYEECIGHNPDYLPAVGDRMAYFPFLTPCVVTERWLNDDGDGWHIVLTRAESPSEKRPPWDRPKDLTDCAGGCSFYHRRQDDTSQGVCCHAHVPCNLRFPCV